MPSSMVSSLLSTFDSRSIGEIASRFGQPKEAVSQGLESSAACLLGALANKAGDSKCLSELFKLVSEAPSNVTMFDLMGAVTNPNRMSSATSSLLDSGKKLLSFAFGGNQSSITDAVGRSTGLRSGVAASLMSMAAPMMMSTLGRLVHSDRMSPVGLGRFLASESESVRDLLPPGVSNLIKATPPTPPKETPSTRPIALGAIPETEAIREPATIPEPTIKSRGLWWLIPLLLLPVLIYWGYRARHPVVHVVPLAPLNRVIRTVPGDIFVNIPPNGPAARLLAFIRDPSKGVEPATWFDFDQLLFNTNSATLRPESQDQLRNIALILRTNPNVHIQIGGFTDNSGDSGRNLKLSQDRANGVMAQLVRLGIAPDRLEAQGYGEQSPLADNSTAEGRARNRRVSIRVTQK